jgi:membrane fusion protein, epimerase transport system
MNTRLAPADLRQVSLAALLAGVTPTVEHATSLRVQGLRVWLPLLMAAAAIVAWSAWAPLAGAVVATGQVQTEFGRKTVQHQEGGIVRDVLVRQGQNVRRGDALVVVGDLRSDAALDVLRKQRDAERVRAARAQAELNLSENVDWPADMPASDGTVQRERQLFDARRRTLDEQLAALQSQARDANARTVALAAQLDSALRATRLGRDELDLYRPLVESGFVLKTRLLSLERGVADLNARAEATRAQMAEARMQVGALTNSIAQARGAYLQRAGEELKDANARLREIDDRLRPSQDQVDRQTVRAPVDGVVMAMRVSAPGTVVGPREALLEVVPSNESLVVELRVDPRDIDYVNKGDAAEVRLAAFDARNTKLLQATVSAVSPDAVVDTASQRSWYVAQVRVDARELARQPHLRLQAGMPAEVFVATPPRSLLAYLLEPLNLFARRGLREP